MKSFSFVIILLCLGTIDCSKSLQFVGNQENATQSIFVVSIQRLKKHVCCGSIVAAKWVLTAAACIKLDFNQFKIRYGLVDCYLDDQTTATTRSIVDQETSVHDALSLLKVDRAFTIILFSVFAKLPSSEHTSNHGLVFGWDRGTGEATNLLKCVMFYIKEEQESMDNDSVTNYKFKAGGNETGISRGNIGSPFVSENTIIGIASDISTFNGSSPDIFYRVFKFVEWINRTTR